MSLSARFGLIAVCLLRLLLGNDILLKAQLITQPTTLGMASWGQSIFQKSIQDSTLYITNVGFNNIVGGRYFTLSSPNSSAWKDLGKLDSISNDILYWDPRVNKAYINDSFALLPVAKTFYDTSGKLQGSMIEVYRFSVTDTFFEKLNMYTGINNNAYDVVSTLSTREKTFVTGELIDTALWNSRIGNVSDNYLIRFDSLGNIDLEVIYGNNGYDQPYSIIPYQDGGCLISSVTDVDTTSGGILFQGMIYRMDSNGIQTGVFTPRPPRPGFNMRIFIVGQTPDGGYLIRYDEAGMALDTDDPFIHYIVKVDSSFETEWEKESIVYWDARFIFNGYGIYGGLVNTDGSALMCGSHIYDNYGWVGKLNQAGNYDWRLTLWQHPGLDSSDLGRFCIITDCIEKPGGGWWCTGSARDSSRIQKAFLLSIDSSGCVDQFCPEILSSTEYFTPAVTRVNVYPNPAHQQLNIEWESDAGASAANWELRNVMGQVVLQRELSMGTTTLQLPDLPSGLYHWALRDKTRSLGSGRLVVE